MDFISIEKLRSIASSESFSKPYYRKLDEAIESLLESGVIKSVIENEHFFYPKYLWQDDRDIELFFFTKEKLIKCTYENDGVINIKTRFLEEIDLFELKNLDINQRTAELNVTFTDGEVYTFTSNDSNDSWKYKFYMLFLRFIVYYFKHPSGGFFFCPKQTKIFGGGI